jgi:hypothetical protein
MTIQEFYDDLAKHDWYYSFSDDGRVFKQGEARERQLKSTAAQVRGGKELFQAFCEWRKSHGSLPRPVRPPSMDDPMF